MPLPPPCPRVLLHSLLETRGGAARVADLLAQSLPALGVEARRSFELAETRTGERLLARAPWPATLASASAVGTLLHVHGSRDWPAMLALLRDLGTRAVVSLHDLSLFAGGCAIPANCPGFGAGCADPCPRGHLDSADRLRRQLALLRAARPVLVCPSRWIRDQAKPLAPELDFRVIPNGVEWPEALPDPCSARAELGVAPAARVAVFVAHGGEAAGLKSGGQWRALWAAIKDRVPSAVGVFVGGEASRREGDLIVLPYLDQTRLRTTMAAADVLVYPTLADNHPLVILEAMASGAAVVSYAVGGVPEQIVHEQTGLLIPPNDVEALVQAAAWLLAGGRAARLGEQAFARGRTRFCVERMAFDHRKLYQALAPGVSGHTE